MRQSFLAKGWCRFRCDPALADWVRQTLPAARAAVAAPENADWRRCRGTWFAGVNVLPNDADGAVDNGPKITGEAVDFIRDALGHRRIAFDRGQVSVCYPGYPQKMAAESDAAYRYRRDRDAAHLDGLLAKGPKRRRHVRQHHGFLLGIPMLEASANAAPLVVWEGSHEIVRQTFRSAFGGLPAADWAALDITDVYQAARREIFDCCERREIAAQPGEAYLVHRLALHGTAPWADAAEAGPDGRMIVYFRPEIGGAEAWLNAP